MAPCRGTTGSEACLLLYSVVGNSLIFPISFALLAKFEAGKPGAHCYTAGRFRSFPGKPDGESGSASLCNDALPEFSGIKPKGWYAAEVLWK